MNIFNILTVYPEFFDSFNNHGLVKKGLEKKLIDINVFNLRDFTNDKHNRVDFKTYGGGPGMVLQYQPVKNALEVINSKKCYFLSPQGKTLSQKKLNDLSKEKNVTLLCGRYEGVDQRIVDSLVDEEISIGNYILSGGELPAACIIEGITRLIPGIAENIESIKNDSFSDQILDYPHYTKPESIDKLNVPNVLLSGNHREIELWRRKQSLGLTMIKRPELLKNVNLSEEDDRLLQEFISEKKEEKSE
tara:strand:- start:334 stop:1074 length:741 start_codon:yes stop_codon:yes gene_type:complete